MSDVPLIVPSKITEEQADCIGCPVAMYEKIVATAALFAPLGWYAMHNRITKRPPLYFDENEEGKEKC